MVAFHRSTGGKATILLTPVADPSRYGLVRTGADGRVETFLEKPRPEEIDTDLINAGLYVLEPEVLELVPPGRPVSIEREVFPQLAAEGSVYGTALPGYWLDVGTPESYLQAHRDVLERNLETEIGNLLGRDYTFCGEGSQVDPAARLVPPVYVGGSVAAGARIGSVAVIARGAQVGRDATVDNAVIGAGAVIGDGCTVVDSIVGEGAVLGDGCEVRGMSIVGPGARIGAGNRLAAGVRVAADATIPEGALDFA
jgi:mannose-1-phosphate guanylyltransferase